MARSNEMFVALYAIGAPRPMKMGTTVSLWHYDEALFTSTNLPILRCPIREQSPHEFGIAFNCQQQRASRRIGRASVLLPVAQSRDGQVEGSSKFCLRHPEALSQHLDARHSAHPCQLLGSERLRIRIRQRCGHDLFISHGIETRPIGIAPRPRFTRFHGYPRSTGLAHVV